MKIQENSDYIENSPLRHDVDKLLKDIRITAMNNLYVAYLEKVTDINGQLMLLNDEISSVMCKQPQRDRITNLLEQKAKLLTEKHMLQTKANLFANEAYTNRMVVSHVVGNMQQSIPMHISKKTAMSSAIQQVGFRLIKMKAMQNEKLSAATISYYTAKFIYRLFDLLFGEHGGDAAQDVSILLNDNSCATPTIVSDFLAEKWQKWLAQSISKQERYLLTSDAKIIKQVKIKQEINYKQKILEITQMLKQRLWCIKSDAFPSQLNITEQDIQEFFQQDEKALLLSILKKVLATTYCAKLECSSGLWSGKNKQTFFSSQDSNHYTRRGETASINNSGLPKPRNC